MRTETILNEANYFKGVSDGLLKAIAMLQKMEETESEERKEEGEQIG